MSNRRIIITESEKKSILSMYGIFEQEDKDPKQISIKGQSFFDNGKWKNLSDAGLQNLNKQLEDATLFLSKNKGSIVYVKIIAGESRVTNRDNENIDPNTKRGKEVPPLYLSKQRYETMKKKLTDFFQGLIDSGVINQMPIFEIPEYKLGETEYTGPSDLNDPVKKQAYDKERFVEVELKIQSPSECIVGLNILVYYDKENPCGKPHICDDAEFFVLLNDIQIGEVNLNNKRLQGASVIPDPLIVTDSLAKQIMGDTPKNIEIKLKCKYSDRRCHSSTPRVKVTKGDTIVFDDCAPNIRKVDENDYSPRLILILDQCGEQVIKLGTDISSSGEEESQVKVEEKPQEIKYDESKVKLDDFINQLVNDGRVTKNQDGTLTALKSTQITSFGKTYVATKGKKFKLIT